MILTITLCYFMGLARRNGDSWELITLYVIFMISIYQRPAIMYAFYFIILYGGKEYLCSCDKVNGYK